MHGEKDVEPVRSIYGGCEEDAWVSEKRLVKRTF